MVKPAVNGLLLVLVRHAKSSWKQPVADVERPLNGRGRRDAPFMANRLRTWMSAHDRGALCMLVSPARRAQDTADFFEAAFPARDCARLTVPSLYGGGTREICNLVEKQPACYPTLVLFGHNPEFTAAINDLTGNRLENLPTCGMACLAPNAARWQDFGTGRCDLLALDYPKLHGKIGGRRK